MSRRNLNPATLVRNVQPRLRLPTTQRTVPSPCSATAGRPPNEAVGRGRKVPRCRFPWGALRRVLHGVRRTPPPSSQIR